MDKHKELIHSRIGELRREELRLSSLHKRFRMCNHDEALAFIEGEIKGLKWTLDHCFNEHNEPNTIEQ